ncbi:MAG: hypothetical protein K6E20_05750 [Acholeplasmatales bacterium]|nr:hypothetical protein [Acholeplasmatales bacterium]
MKKQLIANILILIASFTGILIAFIFDGYFNLKYYTNWSNLLALVSSILFIINYLLKDKINYVLKFFKINTALMLTVTLLIVLFVLIPTYDWNVSFFLLKRQASFVHFIVPVLNVLVFIFVEKYNYNKKEKIWMSLSISLIYIILISILILTKTVTPPYNFLDYYHESIIFTIIVIFVIILMLIGFSFLYTSERIKKLD